MENVTFPGVENLAPQQPALLRDMILQNPKAFDFSDIPLGDTPTDSEKENAMATLADALGEYSHVKGAIYAKSPTLEEEIAFLEYEEAAQTISLKENVEKVVALATRLFAVREGENYRPITEAEVKANFRMKTLIETINKFIGYSFGADPN